MIPDRDRAHDVHAHGAPIALQLRNNANDAQIWSFLTLPADPLPNQAQALPNGTYKIVNSLTGTVLDVANTVGKPVLGLVSKGGNHHEWIVTRDVGGRGRYTLKRTIDIVDLFLAPDVAEGDLPRNGTALIGHTAAAHFMVWRVPGTPIYKIFFDAHVIDTESVRGLAVNLPVVDGKPDSFNGAIVSLQAAEAQEWRFVKVPDQV
ncbi:hypothetical protein BYT27DRAFT_6490528 [Phlegmacium glaucopus]|nr:hypothetical protein BYT27DRAFT_6490528 [Phlegmacium glaucopus]